jgi:hypothetical protein
MVKFSTQITIPTHYVDVLEYERKGIGRLVGQKTQAPEICLTEMAEANQPESRWKVASRWEVAEIGLVLAVPKQSLSGAGRQRERPIWRRSAAPLPLRMKRKASLTASVAASIDVNGIAAAPVGDA